MTKEKTEMLSVTGKAKEDRQDIHITKEMLLAGFRDGLVSFVRDPNSDRGTVCRIGEYWFYFDGTTGEEEEPEYYHNLCSSAHQWSIVIDPLYDALQDLKADGEEDEYEYYYWYLKEKGSKSIKEEYVKKSTVYGIIAQQEQKLMELCANTKNQTIFMRINEQLKAVTLLKYAIADMPADLWY